MARGTSFASLIVVAAAACVGEDANLVTSGGFEPKTGEVYTVSAQMRKVLDVEPGQDGLVSIIGMDATGSPIEGETEAGNCFFVDDFVVTKT